MKKMLFLMPAMALGLLAISARAQTYPDATFNNLTVVNSVSAPGQITNADLAPVAANTVKCNPTTASGSPVDCVKNESNPFDFGAIAGSTVASATNTAAFQNAMAANPVFHCPDGQTFYIGNVVVPSTTTRIYGACTLIASGALTSGQGILEIAGNNTGLIVEGPTITAAIATYPSSVGVRVSSSSNFTVRNVNVTAAGTGIQTINASNFNLQSNTVSSFGLIGFYVTGSSSKNGNLTNNYVNGNLLSTSSHCISVAQGSSYTVTGNQVYNCWNFGISVAGVPSSQGITSNVNVANNMINGTRPECINFENVAVGSVTGNTCVFNGNSIDFGMSFFGAPGTSPQEVAQDINVTGNTIISPCKAGIALADVVFRVSVVGNYIFNANTCNGNAADYQSAILLYGGSNGANNVSNNFVYDSSARMAWQIGEGTFTDGTGNPNGNFLEGMAGTVGTSGQISSIGSSTQVINSANAWIPYTPTLTCGSGSPGSQTATGSYKQLGKTVQIQINATLSSVGTCASSVKVSLPFAAASNAVLSGRETAMTGVVLNGQLSAGASTAAISTYNNTSPIAAGDSYNLSGSYQRQ